MRSLAKQNGVTEQLKAENQMEWVRQMNACRVQAEAIAEDEYLEGTIVKILGIEVYDAVT